MGADLFPMSVVLPARRTVPGLRIAEVTHPDPQHGNGRGEADRAKVDVPFRCKDR